MHEAPRGRMNTRRFRASAISSWVKRANSSTHRGGRSVCFLLRVAKVAPARGAPVNPGWRSAEAAEGMMGGIKG